MHEIHTLIAHRKHVAWIVLALTLLLIPGVLHAECPASGENESAWNIGVNRGYIAAFPIAFNEDPLTHRLELRVCIYDAESAEPLRNLPFDLLRYSGKPNHSGGPRISDLSYYRPAQSDALPSELVMQGNTSASGEIFIEGLPKAELEGSPPAQYALVPDWNSIEADGISINFWFAKVVVSEITIERVSAY